MASPIFHTNPLFVQLVRLHQNYTLIHHLITHIIVPLVPVKATEVVDPSISLAHSTVLGMLVDRGLHQALEGLPQAKFKPILCTVLLSLSEAQCRAYNNNQSLVEENMAEPEGQPPLYEAPCLAFLSPTPKPRPDPHSPCPIWSPSPARSLTSYSSTNTHVPDHQTTHCS